MKIHSITLKNTAHFSQLQLQFFTTDPAITLIIGEQSSGKTTLLKHTYHALTWFCARYKDLRTAGVVMLDHEIKREMQQSKIEIEVIFPAEIGSLEESSTVQTLPMQHCVWQLYKTQSQNGVGISKGNIAQLEQLVMLYHKAVARDPLQGLPMIAYYPAERFVNEMNLLSKNNPAIFQSSHAYELVSMPYTTFSRFFEWLREVHDIENAQMAQRLQQLMLDPNSTSLNLALQEQRSSPHLQALRESLHTVLPELTDIRLHYQPKLQLVVTYAGQEVLYQQLSHSIRNWIALVGDIVRRLCILNPKHLYPCLEGEGVLMIDAIDYQLDQAHCAEILPRLHQAFPRLQIIATATRMDMLEHNAHYQCLRLTQRQLHPIELQPLQSQFDQIYENLLQDHSDHASEMLPIPETDEQRLENLLQQIQNELSNEQQQELIRRLDDGSNFKTQVEANE